LSRKIKKALRGAFDAPEAKRKMSFLMSFTLPRTTRLDFVITQVGFIRKRIWVASFVAIALVLLGLHLQDDINSLIWIVSSFLPFISVLGIAEIAKSASYNMSELEMSCRYSLLDIALARLGILGTVNGITFATIIVFIARVSDIGLFISIPYLFIPYLLACLLSLFSLNRFRGKERLNICGVASCLVSVASFIYYNWVELAFADERWLFMAFAVLLVLTGVEIIKFIRKMEDYQWNLSLTA